MTSEQWLDQFRINASTPDRIPWADRPTLSPAERTAVSSSIREFQLGESSEGRHLQSAADRFALATGDTSYAVAMRYFIREEQRHAAYLARFLADEGVALKTRTWADSAFRRLRHLGHLETAIAVLITAEIVAQVYYLALRRATGSRVLRAICRRVLADEAAHVRFQAERLAILRRRQGTTGPAPAPRRAPRSIRFGAGGRLAQSRHCPGARRLPTARLLDGGMACVQSGRGTDGPGPLQLGWRHGTRRLKSHQTM
jgi:hypothetical protein